MIYVCYMCIYIYIIIQLCTLRFSTVFSGKSLLLQMLILRNLRRKWAGWTIRDCFGGKQNVGSFQSRKYPNFHFQRWNCWQSTEHTPAPTSNQQPATRCFMWSRVLPLWHWVGMCAQWIWVCRNTSRTFLSAQTRFAAKCRGNGAWCWTSDGNNGTEAVGLIFWKQMSWKMWNPGS